MTANPDTPVHVRWTARLGALAVTAAGLLILAIAAATCAAKAKHALTGQNTSENQPSA